MLSLLLLQGGAKIASHKYIDYHRDILKSAATATISSANIGWDIKTIKEYILFKMSYKELKDDKPEPNTSNCIAYAEILSTLMMTAMVCATLLALQNMWVQEKHDEMSYMRGFSP